MAAREATRVGGVRSHVWAPQTKVVGPMVSRVTWHGGRGRRTSADGPLSSLQITESSTPERTRLSKPWLTITAGRTLMDGQGRDTWTTSSRTHAFRAMTSSVA
jgi:hypothetical protein